VRNRLESQYRANVDRAKGLFVEWLSKNPDDADVRSKLSVALELLGALPGR
jgi:hypothetical protein